MGLGADRSLRYDSLAALAGDRLFNGRDVGSARENRLHFLLRYEGKRATVSLVPYGGAVDARGVTVNPFGGARAEWRYKIYDGESVQISPILAAEGTHYRFNAFAIDYGADGVRQANEPRAGGYFSPQLFGSGETGLALSAKLGDSAFFEIEGGPAIQYVQEQGPASDVGAGGQGKVELVWYFLPSVHWAIGADVKSFGSAYTRAEATTRIGIDF